MTKLELMRHLVALESDLVAGFLAEGMTYGDASACAAAQIMADYGVTELELARFGATVR